MAILPISQKQRGKYFKEWQKLQHIYFFNALGDKKIENIDFETFLLIKCLRERYY